MDTSKSHQAIAILSIATIGTLLRLVAAIWPHPYRHDELASVFFAQLPFLESITRDNIPPLFPLLAHLWAMIVPVENEQLVRLLPLSFSLLTLLYSVKRWKDPAILVWLALSPFSINFAMEFRAYSLLELATVLFIGESFRHGSVAQSRISPRLTFIAIFMILSHWLSFITLAGYLLMRALQVKNRRQQAYTLIGLIVLCIVGLFAESAFVRGPPLQWMGVSQHVGRPFFFSEPYYTLGHYSRVWAIGGLLLVALSFRIQQAKPYVVFFFCSLLITYTVELYFGRSLGYRRFLITLMILQCITAGIASSEVLRSCGLFNKESKRLQAAKLPLAAILIYGFLICTKKISEDIVTPTTGWKSAAITLCPAESSVTGLHIWGHPSLQFYFPASCAKTSAELSEGDWLVSKTIWSEFERQSNRLYGDLVFLTRRAEFGTKSRDPIILVTLSVARD